MVSVRGRGLVKMSENYELDLEVAPNPIEIYLEFIPYVDATKSFKVFQADYAVSDWVVASSPASIKIASTQHGLAHIAGVNILLKDALSDKYESAIMEYNIDSVENSIILYSDIPCDCRILLLGDATK